MDANNRDPFETFEKFAVGIAVIGLVLLTLAYFGIPALQLGEERQAFAQAVVTNLVPTLLVFILAYLVLYRRIQKLRSEKETELFARKVADEVANRIGSESTNSLFLEDVPENFRDDLKRAREIWIVSATANTILNNYFTLLETRLKEGASIKVLIINHESPAFEMAMTRNYMQQDINNFRNIARGHLKYLSDLKKVAPERLEVRTINNPLSFGANLIDPDTSTGILYLKHYPYRTPGGAKPVFVFSKRKHKRWFEFYRQEISLMWDDATVLQV